jgi:hypothetical protein
MLKFLSLDSVLILWWFLTDVSIREKPSAVNKTFRNSHCFNAQSVCKHRKLCICWWFIANYLLLIRGKIGKIQQQSLLGRADLLFRNKKHVAWETGQDRNCRSWFDYRLQCTHTHTHTRAHTHNTQHTQERNHIKSTGQELPTGLSIPSNVSIYYIHHHH